VQEADQRPSGQLAITRRGMRLVQGIAASAVGLLVLAVSGLGASDDAAADWWVGLRGQEALDAAPCPDPEGVAAGTVSPARVERAREGRFEVFGGEPTELRVPIDWRTDPLGAHRYRQNLHKLRFLTPLLASYEASGNTDDLRAAVAIAADWVTQNERGEPRTPPEAWADKVVGDRIPYLSYILLAGACEDVLEPAERRLLLDSIADHGRALAAEENYVPDNHGLFVDLGLLRLSEAFPFLDQAADWRALARERFESTLLGRLSEGLWLEHSSAYQFLAVRPLEQFLATYGEDPELAALLAEMRDTAGWFVKPDGEMTQFGDSNLEPVPEWAAESAAQTGLRAFLDAGFAFVRAEGEGGDVGYLAVTAGFHNLTHKHADELSFELFDHGVSVVTDTGLYHKDPGPERDFVVSNRAHSGLSVDALDLAIDDPDAAYGSAILAAGEGEGWYAIEGKNPLVKPQGVRHRRLFLYRPGAALLVVDDLRADSSHTYTRYLQFGPEIEIDAEPEGQVELTAAGLTGAVTDLATDAPATRSETRGQELPPQGFTAPDFREFVPRWTVAYTDVAASETRVLSISLDESGLRADGVSAAGATTSIELVDAAGTETVLDVVRDGETLSIVPGG
jgi:hypothetical protein